MLLQADRRVAGEGLSTVPAMASAWSPQVHSRSLKEGVLAAAQCGQYLTAALQEGCAPRDPPTSASRPQLLEEGHFF